MVVPYVQGLFDNLVWDSGLLVLNLIFNPCGAAKFSGPFDERGFIAFHCRSETPATVGLDDNTLTSVDPLAHLQTRAFSCLVFPMGHEDLGRVFRPEDAGDGYAFLQKVVCENH